MNYRHAFHAGNFADCFKHAVLLWCLAALQRKPAGLFVLDTHAGAGHYDLGADPAQRTGEARDGILRLLDNPPLALLDYVALAARDLYPGSPAIIRAVLRPQDRLACCELHPEEAGLLRRRFRHDPQTAVHQRDGYEAVGALLPPASPKRALVLVDPPYEAPDEASRVAQAIRAAHSRMPGATLLAWYPVKHRAPARALHADVMVPDAVAAELLLREPLDPGRLNGCGLLVVNPPYGFAAGLAPILAALLAQLGNRERGEATRIVRLTAE